MKKYFAYERNPMGKLQPVIFTGDVPKQSSGGHLTEKTQVVELPETYHDFDIHTLSVMYPKPGN